MERFDGVIMLTWSNWKTEPRSNRYHHAIRFARSLPVLFVQPDDAPTDSLVEKSNVEGVHIVHVGGAYDERTYDKLDKIIASFKLRKPLIWVYNSFFYRYLDRHTDKYIVYHATEAYFTTEGTIHASNDVSVLRPSLLETLKRADLLVCVSPDVELSYVQEAEFIGKTLVLPNGCDFEFWKERTSRKNGLISGGHPIVLYQGGINNRLDYELLKGVATRLPNWCFVFCGREVPSPGWSELKALTNVRYVGELTPEAVADLSLTAKIGLMPFVDEPVIHMSMPLKAFEYVACGLPVVTIPIKALEAHREFFSFARTTEEFVTAMKSVAETRDDPMAIQRRMAIAEKNSYDARFNELVTLLSGQWKSPAPADEPLNILILYDLRSTHVPTIKEHIASFERYSRHNVFYLAATEGTATEDKSATGLDLYAFDAIVVHYSVRLSLDWHLNHVIAEKLETFQGRKILFIQDEYDTTNIALTWMDRFQFDIVYTCIPVKYIDDVYPGARFPKTRFLPTLTGYVPEALSSKGKQTQTSKRHLHIAYRGRDLPHFYGDLGREKFRIGVDLKRFAAERGVPVDIEVDSATRIYGDGWYDFLATARATLGTESGSNVFDFTGELAEAALQNPQMSYEEYRATFLGPHEGKIRMNQISPKIFEAISMRTALILFEGEYSGVVKSYVHFFVLKKDYSNIDEMFRFLDDGVALDAMTERAYKDIIASGDYSYARFIKGFDSDLESLFSKPSRGIILAMPRLLLPRIGSEVRNATTTPTGPLLSTKIINAHDYQRAAAMIQFLQARYTELRLEEGMYETRRPFYYRLARRVWRTIPSDVRSWIVKVARFALKKHRPRSC